MSHSIKEPRVRGRMDPTVKALWVKALRSRKYKQGRGSLRSADQGYCCLGVLCDVIDPTAWSSPSRGHYYHEWRGMFVTLDARVVRGLTQPVICFLATHNDAGGQGHWGFRKIADWVEDNL